MTDSAPRARISDLARLVALHAPRDGTFELRVPGTYAIRVSRASDAMTHALQRSAICIIAQGAKTVMVGDALHEYEAGRVAVYSVDVPIAAQITRASAAEPWLNFKIDLDPGHVTAIAAKVYPRGIPESNDNRALYVVAADGTIIDAAVRFLDALARPEDARLVAPLALEELLIRLIQSPVGSRIAQLGKAESSLHRIATAVYWLRTNFDQPVTMDELAERVHLSTSAFHRQFKAVTAMSPLQYQKTLRLQEARRLLVSESLEIGEASRRVGYASASQFSRDYSRFFGDAPQRDASRLRGTSPGTSD